MITEKKTLLIESQYAGNIHYYARMLHHGKVLMERHEHFQKASFRNRCYIAMPDGVMRLSIPMQKGRSNRRTINEMKISYEWDWQKHHWNSFMAAYRSSPYFEYYEDDLYALYTRKMVYLLDFNEHICHFVLEAINAKSLIDIQYTEEFEKKYDESKVLDFRSAILPSKERSRPDSLFEAPVYHQVFEKKTGFLPNLSIFDLLFAEGPKALLVLKNAMS